MASDATPASRRARDGHELPQHLAAIQAAGADDRPVPAGILAFSGFVPVVEGWEPDLAGRAGTRVFIAHGRNDPVMEVGFARRARDLLEGGGIPVDYHESDAGHHIDPEHVPAAIAWLGTTLTPAGADAR